MSDLTSDLLWTVEFRKSLIFFLVCVIHLHDFSSLELVNSNAIDLKISMSYSRPKTLSLKFDDGEETVTVKPFMTLQKVTFPKHTSQSVTITMGEVMAGKQFTDACISELYLK